MKKLIFFSALLLSASVSKASLGPLCEVKISYHLKSGVVEEAKLRPSARSQAECKQKARTVKVHSAPTNAVRKVVAVNWKPKR